MSGARRDPPGARRPRFAGIRPDAPGFHRATFPRNSETKKTGVSGDTPARWALVKEKKSGFREQDLRKPRASIRCNYGTERRGRAAVGPAGSPPPQPRDRLLTRGEADLPAAPVLRSGATAPFRKTDAAGVTPRPTRGTGTDRQIRFGCQDQTGKIHVNSTLRPGIGAARAPPESRFRAGANPFTGPETNAARPGRESGIQVGAGQCEVSVVSWGDIPMIPPSPQSRRDRGRVKAPKL